MKSVKKNQYILAGKVLLVAHITSSVLSVR